MSALLSHFLHVLSQYIAIPSPASFFRTDTSMPSDSVSTPNISAATHVVDPSKPRPASLVYSTRWKENMVGSDTGTDAGRPWSLKGLVVAPQVSCPPVPATVISATSSGLIKQGLREETECSEIQDSCPDPDTSVNSSFNISLISDTSTSASEDDELPEPSFSLMYDIFTPVLHHQPRFESSLSDNDDLLSIYAPHISTAAMHSRNLAPVKCGLGLSGIPKKDGSEGPFDGLGLVGVRSSGRVWRHDVESIEEVDEGEEEEWEADSNLSRTFLREAVYTWLDDPSHGHALSPIPEGDGEGETEGPLLSDILVESPLPTLLDFEKDVQPESKNAPECVGLDRGPVLFEKPVHSVITVASPEPGNAKRSPRRKVTLTRDLSAATISSSLKRSTSCSGSSTMSFASPSSSSSGLNSSPSSSRVSSRRSSPSLSPVRRLPMSSSSSSLPPVRRSLTPIPGGKPGVRSVTPVPSSNKTRQVPGSGANKSRPTTPVGSDPGVRRSRSLGNGDAKLSGQRGWRV